MADYIIHKAVELKDCNAAFKKKHPTIDSLGNYWLQKKYDGCCGIAIIREDGDSQMLSRTGEDYSVSCAHILEALKNARDSCEDMGPASFVVIGEVWHPRMSFQDISGSFRRQTKGVQDHLQFVANDTLTYSEFLSGEGVEPYAERFDWLHSLIDDEDRDSVLRVASTYLPGTAGRDDPQSAAKRWKAQGGYDGAILRDPCAKWVVAGNGSGGEIIKVKPALSLDLLVIGVTAGKGKYSDTLGAIIVKRGNLPLEVSGMTDEQRKLWWENPDLIIGKIVEVEAMGEYPSGKLREPRFKGVRFDKVKPD